MSSLRTSVLVEGHLLKKVNLSVGADRKKRSQMFLLALKISIAKNSGKTSSSAVRYQQFAGGTSLIHLVLPCEIYEILTDIRSSAKVSVSALLSEGLELLFGNLNSNKMDSYPFYCYRVNVFEKGGWCVQIKKWKIKTGIPRDTG